MKHDEQAELYKTQQSLTEWLHDIDYKDTEAMRVEDNEKRERLRAVQDVIGIPFDAPVQFEAVELRDRTKRLTSYINKHGDDLCALRLIPKSSGLPKLRMRGKTVRAALEWFDEQAVEAEKYRADYMPHANSSRWATIFVVNQHGIQGEIIEGGHYQLTQGFFESSTPTIFTYYFNSLHLSKENQAAREHLEIIIAHLHAADTKKQEILKQTLNATFEHDYLVGYFETVDTEQFGLWFVDYNRLLGEMFKDVKVVAHSPRKDVIVQGQVGCEGVVEGVVKVIESVDEDSSIPPGSVLVCPVTTPLYVPLMKDAVAIVTDQGGILSHAAIVARELGKPCIVGTGNATKVLKDGQRVRVDTKNGSVTVLK
ncbi:hypothetical protein KA047_01505 [Candidatus Saccharibacteria bacterium]|nr:hypothetical protein [Candidatus Saccharibacteria bacterium]